MKNKINRREFLRSTGIGAASFFLTQQKVSAQLLPRSTKRPNVLFILHDQLRADACGVYNGKNICTPNIDRLASQSMLFRNSVSSCPLCSPYRAMLQTGRYPTHSGTVTNFTDTNPNQHCIAHIFRDAGYHTGFIGKWHLAAGGWKGVDKFKLDKETAAIYRQKKLEGSLANTEFIPPGANRLGYEHWQAYNFHMVFHNSWYYEDAPEKLYMPKFETDSEIDMAISFMDKHKNSDQPFFLMVAPHPPHPPFSPKDCPDGYLEKIPQKLHWSENVPKDHPRRKEPLDARCYYAMCKNADDNLGRIMKYLDESCLADNTILVFTSDHGEMNGSHNRNDKMMPYAESVNIPLIMRWPGHIPANTICNTLQTPIDHMPTLCKLAGLSIPDTSDGVDLSPALLGKNKIDRDAVMMANYSSSWDFFQSGTQFPEWRAVRTTQYTYIKWLAGPEELYDNLADPAQMNNLALDRKKPVLLRKMRSKLKVLMAEAHDEFLPGTTYADWVDDKRSIIRSALGAF